MNKNIQEIIKQLTLEEKASLCSGADFWHLKGIERLNIPSIMVTDGPHGLRKQAGESDHIGLAESVKATCFPTASATASSWDVELMREMGEALGEECLQEDVAVLLGPGANIKRSPLCGRNFEYISEDPYLTGHMGAALVNGIQSKGIGTSLKHFAVNNQEYRRMATESVVDERTLREIYLAGFETIVKESQPWTVMCAYNKVEGIYCSDNKKLLTDILKEEWGHTGLVVTDWGACSNRVEGIKAGMELEMPSSGGLNDQRIVEAIKEGRLIEADLDKVVIRLLNLIFKSESNKQDGYKYDVEAHNAIARKAASHSAVLLKNADDLLPLDNNQHIAVIGEFAKNPRYQGAGSSLINPIKLQNAIDELDEQKVVHTYHRGYDSKTDQVEQELIDEAVEAAKKADVAVVFAGLTDNYESEGFDRNHMNMPTNHNVLIEAVAKVNDNVVVVLQNGAPVSMPWISNVKAILECYLGGQAGGPATIDVLYGKVNPSAKLAETIPVKLEDDLASKWFGMGPKTVEYRESIYIGYRYYDTVNQEVQFPFGHGLSYTKYVYSDLKLSQPEMSDSEELVVSLKVKNVGEVTGSEIVQVYVKDLESTIFRPEKELKGFAKIKLEPKEEKVVTIKLDKRAFAYYNVNINDWHVESGDFEILVGASSRDIRLSDSVRVMSSDETVVIPDYRKSAPEYHQLKSGTFQISDQSFSHLLAREIPEQNFLKGESYTINSTLEDVSKTFIGNMIYKQVLKNFKSMTGDTDENSTTMAMMEAIVNDMPLRSMVLMGAGRFTFAMVDGLLMMINGKFVRGLIHILKNRK